MYASSQYINIIGINHKPMCASQNGLVPGTGHCYMIFVGRLAQSV